MQYKNTFINQYLRIKVYTNSKRIYQLIENVLDFDNSYHAKPKIKVEFYLDEVNLRDPDDSNNFLYQSWPDKNKHLLSFFGKRIANIRTDPKTGIVKGNILNYQESSKEHILDFIFFQPLRFILAHYGLFFLHASVVSKDKDCILIIGPQDSGKSTLAFILSQNGFNLLSDDDCYVKLIEGQIKPFPFPTKMGLNERVLKKYPELNRHTLKNYHYGGKCRLSLNHIANHNNYKGLRCKMIIFPRYKGGRNIYIKKLLNKEALHKLTEDNLVVYNKRLFPEISINNFATLYSLTQQADSFQLTYNDNKLDKIAEVIRRKISI